MAFAYHIIFGTYGYWLPNDPRGSWSDFVGSWELFRCGPATKITNPHTFVDISYEHQLCEKFRKALKHPLVRFSEPQIQAVANGFAIAINEGSYAVQACAILSEHVHMIIARHERAIGKIVGHLKARATKQLHEDGLWFMDKRPVWAHGYWKVYIDDAVDLKTAIEYVEANPVKEGKPSQQWPFVLCPS